MFSKRLIFFCGCLLLVASVVSTPAYAKQNGGQVQGWRLFRW